MPIIPFDNPDIRATGEMVVTVDKSQRIYLNRPLQVFLDCVDKPIKLYIGYDPVNHRIGLAKPDVVRLTDVRPVTFSKHAFISARPFIARYQIPYKEGPLHYVYDGKEDGWYTFRLEGTIAEDQPGKGKAGYDK